MARDLLGSNAAGRTNGPRDLLAASDNAQAQQPDVPPLTAVRQFLSGLTKSAEQGVTLGFGDELQAGIGAAVDYLTGKDGSLDDLYSQRLAAERKAVGDFRDAHPVMATAAEVAGSLPLAPVGAGPVRGGFGLVGQGVKAGGIVGGLTGFGTGEGGLEKRLSNAGMGAAVGGMVGGAVPLALGAGGSVINSALMAAGLRNPDVVARNKVLQAMARDGVTADDVAVRLADNTKPQAVMDVAGENTLGLARSAAGVPGQARQRAAEVLEGRQAGQVARLAEDVRAGVAPQNYHDEAASLMSQRATDAAPLYEQAFAKDFVWSDDLANLMTRPSIGGSGGHHDMAPSALKKALKIAKEENVDPKALGLAFNDAGDVVFERVPSMRTLDYVKRGLDDVLERYRDPTTGRLALDTEGRAIDQTRRAFVEALDAANPDYAAARAAWAGPTRARDLMQRGRDFVSMDAPDIAREVARMSDADREFYKIGVAQALRDRLYRDTAQPGHNAALRISGEGLNEKLQAALGPDRAADLLRNIGVENRLTQNRAFVRGGSQTQNKQADVADMQVDPGVLGNLLRGQFGAAGMSAATAALRRASGLTPSTANSLAGLLYETDPVANRAVLNALRDQIARNQAGERTAHAGVNAFARSAGAVLPGLLFGP